MSNDIILTDQDVDEKEPGTPIAKIPKKFCVQVRDMQTKKNETVCFDSIEERTKFVGELDLKKIKLTYKIRRRKQ